MIFTTSTRRHGSTILGWLLGCAVLAMPVVTSAQTMRPANRPLVTAEQERWYLEGQAITLSGSVYHLAGAAVFFNPNEMVRTGDYRGIPLYSLPTRDPYTVVYVPVGRGLMQPYERRRDGEMAGTVGSIASSFPVVRDSEESIASGTLQAFGPPVVAMFGPDAGQPTDATATDAPRPAGTSGTGPTRPAGPLTTALKPTGLNAFYIEYQGRRWFSSGPAIDLDPSALKRTGEYHGFPVYAAADRPAETIYVAVASDAGGLVTPYSTRK